MKFVSGSFCIGGWLCALVPTNLIRYKLNYRFFKVSTVSEYNKVYMAFINYRSNTLYRVHQRKVGAELVDGAF